MRSLRDLDRAVERRWPRFMGAPRAPVWRQVLAFQPMIVTFMIASLIFYREPPLAIGFALTAASMAVATVIYLCLKLAREDREAGVPGEYVRAVFLSFVLSLVLLVLALGAAYLGTSVSGYWYLALLPLVLAAAALGRWERDKGPATRDRWV